MMSALTATVVVAAPGSLPTAAAAVATSAATLSTASASYAFAFAPTAAADVAAPSTDQK
jgi:hypothetical protein